MRTDLDTGLRPLTFLFAAASLIASTRAAYPLTTDSNCNCYKTNATRSNYFAHHHFFDFRNLTQYVNVTNPLSKWEENEFAPPTSTFFHSSNWNDIWAIQNWNNTNLLRLNNTDVNDATTPMINSPNNIYISSDPTSSKATYLTMRTVRHAQFQSSSEFESRSSGYQFLSIRMLARTLGSPGAVTAMFTYRPPPTPQNLLLVQEADLEIRTRDPPTYVQYTNQPSWNSTSDIPDATRNVTLPNRLRWSDWAVYRMDWTPGSSTWFVNGVLHGSISFQAPRDPARVMFNSWSDGGSWSGGMAVGERAEMQIQWVELVFNNTDGKGGGGQWGGGNGGSGGQGRCVNVCSIDETTVLGVPVLITGQNPAIPTQPRPSNPAIPTQPRPSNPATSSQPATGGGGGGCTSKKYDQCGGKNWNGCKNCASGTTCKFSNDYYSQCL